MRLSGTLAILPLIATLFVGCGSRGPALYSVTGKVTLDGQPVPNVNVAFFPSDAKLPSSGGVTNSAGVYKLTTSQGMAGAVAAKHKVSVYGGQASGTTEPSARPEGMYKVGGPKEIDVLFSIEEVRADFAGYEVEELVEKEIELNEGVYHNGLGSVIRFVGKKK